MLFPFRAPAGGFMDHVRVKIFPALTDSSGHTIKYLQPNVFDRYHIVSPGDLQDVARRLTGTISSTVASDVASTRLTAAP